MNHQRVPSWDLDEGPYPFAPPAEHLLLHHNNTLPYAVAAVSTPADLEVAELTWKDGNLAMLGLRHPSRIGKPTPRYPFTASSPAGGTLECIVDQAYGASSSPDLLSWAGGAYRPAAVDALVPCADDGAGKKPVRANENNCVSQGSATPMNLAAATGNGKSTLVTVDTCELTSTVRTDEIGFSATPSDTSAGNQEEGGGSPETENGSFAGTRSLGVDDHDSVSHSLRYERDASGERGMTSMSTKRRRVAAVHNQSERKRRDRINQKMKTLQKLLPRSSKTDKASMLDEVIEHLKLLQAQILMMSRMSTMSPMLLPIMLQQQLQQQQLQISMMAPMTRMSHHIDPSFLGGQGGVGLAPPPMLHPSPFIPLQAAAGAWDAPAIDWMQQHCHRGFPDMFSTFMGGPAQQSMSTEAYSRMAALYQQLYGYNQRI